MQTDVFSVVNNFLKQCKPVHFLQLTISALLYLNTANELVHMLNIKMRRPGKRVRNLAVLSLVHKALCNFSMFSKKCSVRK